MKTTTIYITDEQQLALRELNRRSKVPIAEYIREGIDLVLEKYSHQLPGQLELRPIERPQTGKTGVPTAGGPGLAGKRRKN
jgi:hypothetical protein